MGKVVCLIGARGNSKGVPKKNIHPLGGYPLIAFSIAAGRLCPSVDEVVVSTDSEAIAAVAAQYGASVPFLRPAEIAGDTSLDVEFFQHYLKYVVDQGEELPELLVFLRPTTPLREINVIEQAIETFRADAQCTGLRSMHKTHLTPFKMFRDRDGYAEPFLTYGDDPEFFNLPRQTFPACFIPNGYVDLVRPERILAGDGFYGPRIKLFETESIADIDCIAEFALAQKLLEDPKFKRILTYLEGIPCLPT